MSQLLQQIEEAGERTPVLYFLVPLDRVLKKSMVAVRGEAGTGKTFLLDTRACWEELSLEAATLYWPTTLVHTLTGVP